jgi:hypothetical protein
VRANPEKYPGVMQEWAELVLAKTEAANPRNRPEPAGSPVDKRAASAG